MSTPTIDKKILQEYASLKSEEKRISDRLDELKPTILEAMRANDVDKVETDFGNLTITNRTTWEYSPAIAELQEQEKANGKAKQKISTTIMFKGK